MTLLRLLLPLLAFVAGAACAQPGNLPANDAGPLVPTPAIDPRDAGLRGFVATLRPRALAAGVNPATFDGVIPTLAYNPRVISADRGQPGGSTAQAVAAPMEFQRYAASHVSEGQIARGRSRYTALRPRLAAIEARTGVPEAITLAIYGHETSYGAGTGNYDLLQSLATLAYDGRRRELFAAEYIDALKLLDMGVPRGTLKGSWAGAMGYPQFLPSIYLRLAVDGDGDGRRDIWTNEADALASIGNYLINAGWKPNVPWGVAVLVPSTLDRAGIAPRLISPRCPRVHARHSRWLTVAEWRQRGLQFVGWPVPAETEQAALIEPDGPAATGYLITSNYRALLDYNCSNYYALSVGLLADAVSH